DVTKLGHLKRRAKVDVEADGVGPGAVAGPEVGETGICRVHLQPDAAAAQGVAAPLEAERVEAGADGEVVVVVFPLGVVGEDQVLAASGGGIVGPVEAITPEIAAASAIPDLGGQEQAVFQGLHSRPEALLGHTHGTVSIGFGWLTVARTATSSPR